MSIRSMIIILIAFLIGALISTVHSYYEYYKSKSLNESSRVYHYNFATGEFRK